jgi:hypothetical protein
MIAFDFQFDCPQETGTDSSATMQHAASAAGSSSSGTAGGSPTVTGGSPVPPGHTILSGSYATISDDVAAARAGETVTPASPAYSQVDGAGESSQPSQASACQTVSGFNCASPGAAQAEAQFYPSYENGGHLTPALSPLASDANAERECPGAHGVTRPTTDLSGADWRLQEANKRLQILTTFQSMVGQGVTKTMAAKAVGKGYATIWRYETAFAAEGFDGLIPETDECGRKTILEKLGFTADQVKELMEQVSGLNLDVESTTTALRLFASSDRCPEQLAAVILDPNRCSKHALPPSLRRAATLSANSRKAHRGPRSLDLRGFYIPRKIDIIGGDIFVPDDTTPIFGWWVPWATNDDYPFGVKLLQGQLLRIIDVATQDPVGRVLIAREKSSYRASDIWSWVGFMADDIGLPRLGFQMERGSWDSTLLQGKAVMGSIEGESDPGDVSQERRVGGLRQLPSNVTTWHKTKLPDYPFQKNLQTWTSFLPKSKSIEAYFDRVQALEGCLYGSLGRDQMRRPYEKAKKLFQQCSRPGAKIDPREHFLSGTEIMARLNAMDDFLANEPMEGEVFKGIPRQKFQQAVAEFPLFKMPEESRWLYQRDWKALTITKGWARVRLTDAMSGERYSLHYINPRIFAEIEGRDVLVYYDRENFEKAAQIVAASRFAAGGKEFYPGDFVCEATYFERPGSFLDGDRSGHDIRKLWRNAVMTIYGRAAVHAPSRQLPQEILDRRAQSSAAPHPGPLPTAPSGAERGASHAPTTHVEVDGRPKLRPPQKNLFAARSAEDLAKQSARLNQLAEIMRQNAELANH